MSETQETVAYGIAYSPLMVDMASFWGTEEEARRRIARFPHEGRTLVKRTHTTTITDWEMVEADALDSTRPVVSSTPREASE